MKKLIVIALLLVSTPVFAGTKVAIVDWKEVIEKSTATASLRRQIVTEHEKLKKEFETHAKKIKQEDEGLAQQKAVLSQEAFAKKVKAFKTKVTGIEKKMEGKIKAVDTAGAEALQGVKAVVSEIVQEISKEQQIELVLPKSSTIYATDPLYITEDIIVRLNKRLPDVTVKIEKS